MKCEVLRSDAACAASPRAAAAVQDATHVNSRAASWDSSSGEKIKRPGLCFCESSGFRGDAWVCESQSSHDGVNASMVRSGGFSGAAELTMFKLRIQE